MSEDPQERLKRRLAQKGIRLAGTEAGPGRRPAGSRAPLSFAQERLWFLQRFAPESAAYNLGRSFRLRGPLQIGALRRAISALLERHEALRAVFPADGEGRARVELAPVPPDPLREIDLTGRPPESQSRAAADEEERLVNTPFDVAAGPLLRACLFRLARDDHQLTICVHHLVLDGWSIGILARDLAELYAAGAANRSPALPSLTANYGDYAAWQRKRARDPAWTSALEWWTERLRGVPPLELPTDRPRPGTASGRGRQHRFALDAGTVAALREVARQQATTLFAVLMAGYETLLGRQSGQEDFGVGVSVAGRSHRALEDLIGLFVNTVVFRARLSGDPTFAALVRRIGQESVEVLSRQETPFEQIVDRLQAGRDLARNPVFQAGLFLQNVPPARFALGEAELEALPAESRTAKFDLLLILEEEPGGAVAAALEYSSDLFEPETIARLARRWITLLADGARNPDRRLSALEGLPAAERAEIGGWAEAPRRDYSALPWIHEGPDRIDPAAPAVSDWTGRRLTYGEFCAEAERLARALRGWGVGPEVLVGVCLERSIELVLALHAVLRAGGAYVPLDPAYPADRLAWIAENAGATIVITTRALAGHLPAGRARRLWIDEPWPEGPAAGPRPWGAQAAYMIYTSGSTGRPKGAINTHAGIHNLVAWVREAFPLGRGDRMLQKTPCSFDVSVREFFWPLMAGAELVVAEPGAHRDPARIAALIAERAVTDVNFVPSVFRAFLEAAPAGSCPSLRRIYCTGEELPRDLVERCAAAFGCELHNLYGPTEAAVEFTHEPCGAGAGSVPIGRPMANLEVQILDPAGNLVPPGVAGEILLGGINLARGYHSRADLTADRWVPHPFRSGARLYRTGDLGRWRSDGRIDYLGRTDFQVKLRGQRIELGEIETVLREHPGVRESAVVVRDGRLAAYVVPRGESGSPETLREWLSSRLPEYMVPVSWTELAALPLNPAGKTDRKALPAPAAATAAYAPPQGEREEMLAAAWRDVLGVAQVGRADGYFDLGGDSIVSIRLQARVRQRGWTFALADLFQHQTLAALALRLQPQPPVLSPAPDPAPGFGPLALLPAADRGRLGPEIEDAYPLTMLQSGMVLHAELHPGSPVYHEIFSYELRAVWSEAALRAALAALTRRHPVLRTSFGLRGWSEPVQLVHAAVAIGLTVSDRRQDARAEQDRAAAEWIRAELAAGFAWEQAPLWRAHVMRRTDQTWQFFLSAHHAILDGWSAASLLAELMERYLGLRDPAAGDRPPPFRHYVALERAAVRDSAAREFWRNALAGSSVASLPRRIAGGAPRPSGQASAVRVWRGEELARFEALAARAGAALKHVLLAAHLKTAQVYGGSIDVVTGLISNGRPEETASEQTLGLFLNTVPLRVGMTPGETWEQLIRSAFAAEAALWPHRRYPLAELQKLADRRPLFDTTFNYVHYRGLDAVRSRDDVALLGADYRDQNSFPYFAQYSLDTVERTLTLDLRYDLAEFDPAQAEEFADLSRAALAAMAADPAAPHGASALLSEREWRRAMIEPNGRPLPAGAPRLLQDGFWASCERCPAAIALIDGDRRWSYAELAGRVRAWSRRLSERGAAPERLVAICLERGVDLVTAILAVLSTGAAYVPLDPAYPPARLALLCADASAAWLISRPGLAERLPAGRAELLDAAELAALPPVGPENVQPCPALPSNLAYLIYTSGSTGRPKAAAIEHRSAAALLAWAQAEYSPAELAGTLASTSICFDLSIFELFVPWTAGATVIIAENALALPELPARGEVTLINTVPSAAAELLRQAAIPPSAAVVNLAGEPLTAALADRIYATGTVRKVYDLYGPSEDTTYSTWTLREEGGPETIGRVLPGSCLYLLDENGQPAPAGTVGEIHLGGAGLARGYLGRPEATAERFVPHPWGEPGARLYRTGDLARYRSDGRLEFLGRSDDQVKIRGFRIELGEIRAVLESHRAVAEAVVVARESPGIPGRKRLVAYVAGPAAASVPAAELTRWVGERLPGPYVPSVFVALAALPRTPNGKLDRAALPGPAWPEAVPVSAATTSGAPRTPTEETLVRLWREVLGVPAVGRDDNFFELGGDSILALQISSRAKALGIAVAPRQLFEHPTIAGVSSLSAPVPAPSAPVATGASTSALTPIQHWFFAQNFAEPHHWNQSLLLQARRPMDAGALAAAFAAVGGRHAALRRRFRRAARGWELANDPAASSFEFRGFAAPTSAAFFAECAAAQAALDLERGPLARVLWRPAAGAEPGLLFVVIHHLAIDGVSWRILLEELAQAYESIAAGRAAQWAAAPADAAEWAAWLATIGADAVRGEREHWLALAEIAAEGALGAGRGGSAAAGARRLGGALTAEETEILLRRAPAALHCHINDLLLAALALALRDWTGRQAHLIALEGHGREWPECPLDLAGTVGWLTSLFPVRLDLQGAAGSVRALAAIQAQLAGVPRRGVGYGVGRYLAQPALWPAIEPDLCFNYLGQFDGAIGGAAPFAPVEGAATGEDRSPRAHRAHGIELNGLVAGGILRMEWTYASEKWTAESIAHLADRQLAHLRALLAAAGAAAPAARPAAPAESLLDQAIAEIEL